MLRLSQTAGAAVALALLLPPPVLAATPPPAGCPAGAPQVELGPLYAAVEDAGLFADSKTFADAAPRSDPAGLRARFRADPASGAALAAFVHAHFTAPADAPAPPPLADRPPLSARIDALWPVLTRPPRAPEAFASALPLPRPYVLPGGRFRELYYWDSYFTLEGLLASGRRDLAADLVEDFGALIDRYGFIPNGARTYYLSRSQPPVYFAMLEALPPTSPGALRRSLRRRLREHAFWMAGASGVGPGEARGRVVRLADGSLLNRYRDPCGRPRDESFREDRALAARAARPAAALYREIRSAAESGWDFSSRWTSGSPDLARLRTTRIVPVDLNSLLFGLERGLARDCARLGRARCRIRFARAADARRRAIERHLFDPAAGAYADYDLDREALSPQLSAAALFPLFVGLASPARGAAVAVFVERRLLAPGGLRTTLVRTGQQWDAPNGWAPLQWVGAIGLERYGRRDLAAAVAGRFVRTVEAEYARSGRLLEKYDLEESRAGGGGEYPTQDGFGWTNGVVRAFLARGLAQPGR